MEKPVIFTGAHGNRLYGVLHTPDQPRAKQRIGVNILNPGVKNRVAPNRINLRLARLLTARGFYVLRFDPFGVGDSEGEISSSRQLRVNIWSMIERGLFVPDTLIANDFFIRESNLDSLILIGQCGGANTAALTAGRDKSVKGLVLVDLPGRVVSASADFSEDRMEMMQGKELLALGGSKILSVRAWVNIFTFKSSIWLLPKITYRKIKKRIARIARGKKTDLLLSERFNRELFNACLKDIERMKQVLFLYAERDYALKEYQSDLRPALEHELSPKMLQRIDAYIIKNANHIYTEKAWQDELFAHITNYVDRFR